MTRFIVHIGDGKCGSSSIQASLFDRSQQLEDAGIIYASEHRNGGQFGFVTLLGVKTRSDDGQLLNSAKSVIDQIKSKLETCDYVLLSAESFFSLEPNQVQEILEMISPTITSIDVIAYVRPVDDMYLSLVQQRLKGHQRFLTPPHHKRDLHTILESWQTHPNVTSVTVHAFERSRLIGNSSVSDFESIVKELTGKSLDLEDNTSRSSLTAEQMVVLQRFRRRFLGDHDGKLLPESNRLIRFFENLNRFGPIGNKPALEAVARNAVLANNLKTVQRLNKLFPGLDLRISEGSEEQADEDQFKTRDVRTILSACDSDLVQTYIELIPLFKPHLKDQIPPKSAKAIAALTALSTACPEDILTVIGDYWQAERKADSMMEI